MFFLDRPNSVKPTFIFLRMTCSDGPLKYPIKKKVLPGNWDAGRVKKDTDKINAILDRIATIVRTLLHDRDLKGTVITKGVVENTLNKALGRNTASKNFFEVIDTIINDREAGRELTRDGKRFSPETIRGYRHTRDNLKKFYKNMTFDGITINTYADLIAFFNGKDHSLNSLGKIVKNWKVFLKAAHKRGAHENLIYAHEDFRVPGEDTDDVYLTPAELKKIFEHNLPNKTLDPVRDWFVIDCFTGLRISDIKLLSKQNVLKDTIQIANEKTDTKVVIPIHPYVKSILKKWKGLPPKVTDQEMNRSIKEVCELAGIKEPVLYSVTKGGQRKDFHFMKYQMVSNHTGRRCFITNLLNAGIPDNQVMQLAGIKKHSTLMRYKKTSPEETAKLLAGHSFFK
jgi:integrase